VVANGRMVADTIIHALQIAALPRRLMVDVWVCTKSNHVKGESCSVVRKNNRHRAFRRKINNE
jgi:hypothetical protein